MDGDVAPQDRVPRVARFAPVANDRPELAGSEDEIDILVSTDVLSERQNLQDCGQLVNYDLHWNPTRMVQRAGRIDRIGSPFDTLWITNVFPEAGLERLLGLVESLSRMDMPPQRRIQPRRRVVRAGDGSTAKAPASFATSLPIQQTPLNAMTL